MSEQEMSKLIELSCSILKFLSVNPGNALRCDFLNASDQLISDHIHRNDAIMRFLTPGNGRILMWKEILSGVIGSQCINDYRTVSKMNKIIEKARELVQKKEADELFFSTHNTADTTVLKQLDVFIKAKPDDDNLIAKIRIFAIEMMKVLEFVESKKWQLDATLETYQELKKLVADVEGLTIKVIRKDIEYKEAMDTIKKNDTVTEEVVKQYNRFACVGPENTCKAAFSIVFPDGISNTSPTITKMLDWKENNKYNAYSIVYCDEKDASQIHAIKTLMTRNQNMYKELYPYREVPTMMATPPPPVQVRVPEPPLDRGEYDQRRLSRRGSVSSNTDRENEKLTRKIARFSSSMRDFKARLDNVEPVEDLNEAVIESLKYEVIDMEKKLNSILDYCDEDQEKEVEHIRLSGHECRSGTVLREWKTSLEEILHEKKTKQREDQYARKIKEDYAKTILNNPYCIVKLEKESDFLDFLESVQQVTRELSDITSDLMIANSIKRALVREKDKKEVKTLTTTKDILEVLTRNYAANKSLITKIILPITTLPDPTSFSKSQDNCKSILAFMKRMEEHDLLEHLMETHIANFEFRAFHGNRKQQYLARLAEYTASHVTPSEDVCIGADDPIVASTPVVDRRTSVGIVRKKKPESEKLNTSAMDVLNLKDKMKSSLSKLAVGKKLTFFIDYIKKTELLFLSEMIANIELTRGMNPIQPKQQYVKNGKGFTVNKTEMEQNKPKLAGNGNFGNKVKNSSKEKFEKRLNNPEFQKTCPVGCGQKHYYGSARFCEAFVKLPPDQMRETAKKKRLCGICLQGCGKNGHLGPKECKTNIVCSKCGAKNQHNSLLCNKVPHLQSFNTNMEDEEKDYSEDIEAYYSQLDLETVEEEESVNYVQEDDEIEDADVNYTQREEENSEITEEYLEEEIEINHNQIDINEEVHLIETEEIDAIEADYQFFLTNEYSEGVNQEDCSDFFLYQQAKQAADTLGVKWSKMIAVIRARIIMKIRSDGKTGKIIINECRKNGVNKGGIQEKRFDPKNIRNIPNTDLAPIASKLVMDYIRNLKLKPKKLSELGHTMDLHATASKKWSEDEWKQIVSTKADLKQRNKSEHDELVLKTATMEDSQLDEIVINKIGIKNHAVSVEDWVSNNQLGNSGKKEEVIVFKVTAKDGMEKDIEVRYSDLGMKEADCRMNQMPIIEEHSFPSPNENPNYVHISNEAQGIFKLVYDSLIKQALDLYKEHGLITKGVYLPVLVKIKEVKKQLDDVDIIEINGSKYARIILCIDSGSETPLLDENVAKAFVFDSDSAKPVNVRINTVVGSSCETLGRQVLLFRGIDGVHYPSCALEIGKVGKDKLQPAATIGKLCDLFNFNKATKHHFIKNAGTTPRRCHALISMKELGCFYEALEPERLGGTSPCISPNIKIIRSILSDQLVIAGQPGLNYNCSKYQSLFVDQKTLVNEMEKIVNQRVRITCLKKNASYFTEESLNHEEGPKMMESWNCKYVEVDTEDKTDLNHAEDFEMQNLEVNRIILDKEDAFSCLMAEHDDGGIDAILNKESTKDMPALSGVECEILNTIKSKFNNETMSEEKLMKSFSGIDIHSLLVENDRVMHYSHGADISNDDLENDLQCCNLSCIEMEKLIQTENDLNLRILCDTCRIRECSACNLANSHLTMGEKLKYLKCWRDTKLVQHEGTIRCQVDFLYNTDPKETFKKENSNFIEAKRNIDANINKLKKKGKLQDLITDVEKKIELGTLIAMSDLEYSWVVDNLPHHFSKLHIVHSESSDSTPRRIINNTNSNVPNKATSLSATQLCIANPLMSDFEILTGFCLNEHPMSLDVSKAYLRIMVPYETSVLRLFIWYKDPENMTDLKIFRRGTGDFGDTPMSGSLTLAQRKLLAPACKSSISSCIAKMSNFADNYIDSLMSRSGWLTTTQDLSESSALIGLPLKPGITALATDKEVIKNNENQELSNLFGMSWNIKSDQISPNDYFSFKGKAFGSTIGRKLSEMLPDEVTDKIVTRELLSRMAMQPYDRLNRTLAPIIATMKLLLSRACELVPHNQMKTPLKEYDETFAILVANYLKKLIDFKDIKPFPRCVIPPGNIMYGFCIPSDGGNPGYSAYAYVLSQISELQANIRWDWRTVRDKFGVLSVEEKELLCLDDTSGLSFFTDRRPEKENSYRKKFGKSMELPDVTERVLESRETDRSQYEQQHGISPLKKEDVKAILSSQASDSDELSSHILATRSKSGKRNIPAHETLSKVTSTELALAISKVLTKYSVYSLMHLEFFLPGDSICSAMLFSPHLEIRNTLLLGGVRKAEANLKLLVEELPRASIFLTWIPGVSNPSDFSSKLVTDPIPVINSDFYRNGPAIFKSKKQLHDFCYKYYTPSEGWKWRGLPESLTKINLNASKLRQLLTTEADDPLRSERTKAFIKAADKNAAECHLCMLDELDDSSLKCNSCFTDNLDSQDCAILMMTRSKVREDLHNSQPSQDIKEAAKCDKQNLIASQKDKDISPKVKLVGRSYKKSIKKNIVVKKQQSVSKKKQNINCKVIGKHHAIKHLISKKPTVDQEAHLSKNHDSSGFHQNYQQVCSKENQILQRSSLENVKALIPGNYEYLLTNPILEENIYFELMNRVMDLTVSACRVHHYISAILGFLMKLKNNKKREINTWAETWRCIILTSQHYSQPKTGKLISVRTLSNMILYNPRLTDEQHFGLYGNFALPVISFKDSFALKLIRNAHLQPSMFGKCHRSNKSTIATTTIGIFGTMITKANLLTKELVYNCYTCNKYRERKSIIRMGDVCTRVTSNPRPFQRISIDPLGFVPVKPWINARNEVQGYPLLIKCMDTSAIEVLLMFSNDTNRALMKLLQLEATYKTKIIHLSTDHGSNLIPSNINPSLATDHTRKLFNMLQSNFTALPQAQHQNAAESGAKIFKSYIKKIFNLTKNGKLSALVADEWEYLFKLICADINNIPYIVDDLSNMICPNDLLLFSPMVITSEFETSTHFKNIETFLGLAQQHYQVLQTEMANISRLEHEKHRQMNHNNKSGYLCEISENCIVGWKNSDEKFVTGVILNLNGRTATIKDKTGHIHEQFTGNLIPLATTTFKNYKSQVAVLRQS